MYAFQEEQHPGPDLLKHENTARNRINREHKRDKMRNRVLQRLYDGTFFLAWHVFVACARFRPISFSPIRPYNEGELDIDSVSLLVVELSCASSAMCNAVFDALCAVCCRQDLPTAQQQPPQTQTAHQRMHAPFNAAIGTPIAQFTSDL